MALFKRTGALQDAVPTVNFATKFEFGSERGQFYLDLCENMRAMPGVPITKFLSNYAKRYPNRAVGKMALYWLHRFTETGTLTASLRGTVPDEDLTVLAVFERAGELC